MRQPPSGVRLSPSGHLLCLCVCPPAVFNSVWPEPLLAHINQSQMQKVHCGLAASAASPSPSPDPLSLLILFFCIFFWFHFYGNLYKLSEPFLFSFLFFCFFFFALCVLQPQTIFTARSLYFFNELSSLL